jgi:hypothetical protein
MSTIVTLKDCEVLAETELALRVFYDGAEYWVPKSKCEFNESDNELQIEEWVAIDKGMV